MTPSGTLPLVVGITGASGAPYATRLLEVLLAADREIHLAISPSGQAVIEQELGRRIDLDAFRLETLLGGAARRRPAPLPPLQESHGPDRERLVSDRRDGDLPVQR